MYPISKDFFNTIVTFYIKNLSNEYQVSYENIAKLNEIFF